METSFTSEFDLVIEKATQKAILAELNDSEISKFAVAVDLEYERVMELRFGRMLPKISARRKATG